MRLRFRGNGDGGPSVNGRLGNVGSSMSSSEGSGCGIRGSNTSSNSRKGRKYCSGNETNMVHIDSKMSDGSEGSSGLGVVSLIFFGTLKLFLIASETWNFFPF